jgi:hypothetical protein
MYLNGSMNDNKIIIIIIICNNNSIQFRPQNMHKTKECSADTTGSNVLTKATECFELLMTQAFVLVTSLCFVHEYLFLGS